MSLAGICPPDNGSVATPSLAPHVRCGSRAANYRRRRGTSDDLYVVGVCLNRIGTVRRWVRRHSLTANTISPKRRPKRSLSVSLGSETGAVSVPPPVSMTNDLRTFTRVACKCWRHFCSSSADNRIGPVHSIGSMRSCERSGNLPKKPDAQAEPRRSQGLP